MPKKWNLSEREMKAIYDYAQYMFDTAGKQILGDKFPTASPEEIESMAGLWIAAYGCGVRDERLVYPPRLENGKMTKGIALEYRPYDRN